MIDRLICTLLEARAREQKSNGGTYDEAARAAGKAAHGALVRELGSADAIPLAIETYLHEQAEQSRGPSAAELERFDFDTYDAGWRWREFS